MEGNPRYYWYDLDLIDLNGRSMPLRMAYTRGDEEADTWDGISGAVWDRDTGVLVADLIPGDGECDIAFVSDTPREKFAPHDPLLWDTDEEEEREACEADNHCGLNYANESELERFIGAAILCCGQHFSHPVGLVRRRPPPGRSTVSIGRPTPPGVVCCILASLRRTRRFCS